MKNWFGSLNSFDLFRHLAPPGGTLAEFLPLNQIFWGRFTLEPIKSRFLLNLKFSEVFHNEKFSQELFLKKLLKISKTAFVRSYDNVIFNPNLN